MRLRRFKFLVFLCWLVPIGARAQAPTFVQGVYAEHHISAATTVTATFSGNAGAGHLLFCAGTTAAASSSIAFSDNVGLTWNNITLPNITQTLGSPVLPTPAAMTDANKTNATYLVWASTGGSSTVSAVTMTWTTSATNSSLACLEYSGANLTTPIDGICDNYNLQTQATAYSCLLVAASNAQRIVAIGQYQTAGSNLSLVGLTGVTYTSNSPGVIHGSNISIVTRAGGASSQNGIIVGDAAIGSGITKIEADSASFTYGMVLAVTIKSAGSTVPQSILQGCTVTSSNLLSCATPNGWTFKQADGFETGSLGTGESTCTLTSIETSKAHTGTHALSKQITGGDQQACWILARTQINARETYVSWWEWDDSTTALNQDLWPGGRGDTVDSPGTDLPFNWNPGPVCFYNCAQGQMVIFGEGNGVSAPSFSIYESFLNPQFGQWNQWEMHHRINDPGQSNGTMELWLNRVLIASDYSSNLAGSYDGVNFNIQVGGVYTALTFYGAASVCLPPDGTGTLVSNPNYPDFSVLNPCPLQSPPNGFGPIFNRYFDDIIVLTCATPGTCSTTAPGSTWTPNVKVTSGVSIK